VDTQNKSEQEATKAALPLQNVPSDSEWQDPNAVCKTTKRATAQQVQRSCAKEPKDIKDRTLKPHKQMHVSDPVGLNVSRLKQDVSKSAIPKIQRDPRYKNSKYKAHLHIKSLRIYAKSHTAIDAAINDQLVLMQIRLAWMAAWQADAAIWEEHPEYFASLCNDVLVANKTSQSEMGIKAFVSMQVRPWLGNKCFIISHVMELTEALELQAKLCRARRTSWLHFRAEWVKLMQHKKHGLPQVRCTEDAERLADTTYQAHQMFLQKRTEEHKNISEARRLARMQRQEKEEQERNVRWCERQRRKQEQMIARQKLLQARDARRRGRERASLEKRLAKAVRVVERILDLKARCDAKAERKKRKC
jgi:hypothetical protein